MTDFKAQTRRDGDARNTRSEPSRHRAEPAKPASALSRFARNFGVTGRRTAVVAAACAVLVGVGAAGQASETSARNATASSSTAAPTTANPLTPLDFERVRADNQVPTTGAVAAKSRRGEARQGPGRGARSEGRAEACGEARTEACEEACPCGRQ